MLSVGHLVIHVVSWRGRKPPLAKVFEKFDPALVRVWPAERMVAWPPSLRASLLGTARNSAAVD